MYYVCMYIESFSAFRAARFLFLLHSLPVQRTLVRIAGGLLRRFRLVVLFKVRFRGQRHQVRAIQHVDCASLLHRARHNRSATRHLSIVLVALVPIINAIVVIVLICQEPDQNTVEFFNLPAELSVSLWSVHAHQNAHFFQHGGRPATEHKDGEKYNQARRGHHRAAVCGRHVCHETNRDGASKARPPHEKCLVHAYLTVLFATQVEHSNQRKCGYSAKD